MAKRGPQPKSGNMAPPAYTLCEMVPDAPPWLSDIGQAEWMGRAEDLARAGSLTKACLAPLGIYCDAYASYVELTAYLREHGNTIVSPKGWEAPRPEVTLQTQKAKLMLSYAEKFGFTPSSQSRIAIVPEKTADVDLLEQARRELREQARPN